MQWSSHSGGQNNETRVQFLAKENAFVHVHPLGCHDISWKPARRRNCWTTKFHCIFILSNNWASLHSSHNLTAVSNICEVVLISLFWAPNGLNKLSQICFSFSLKLDWQIDDRIFNRPIMKRIYLPSVKPKALLSCLRIENLDLMPTHACVTICHARWKSLSHYSINWHILKNILII